MKDINVINFFEENNVDFSTNFNSESIEIVFDEELDIEKLQMYR